MDYLLRDSHHAGVDYGRFDWRRLAQTIEAVPGMNGGNPALGVSEGGWHAAEGLILARYFMFTQVYFHKTRVAYNHHLEGALKEILPDGSFPHRLQSFLMNISVGTIGGCWALLKMARAANTGDAFLIGDHYREVCHTPETPNESDLQKLMDQKRD